MSDDRRLDPDRLDWLAAEYALGLLAGEDLGRARALVSGDPEFARAAGRWTGRLVPLLDEVPPALPPPRLWERIAARIEAEAAPAGGKVVQLRRRLNLWRGYAALATALAASLAWLLLTRPAPPPPQAGEAPTMVATMAAEGSPARLVATWSPSSRSLVVAAAVAPAPDRGHSHQLWMIPADGRPRPMGLMPRSGPMHATLPPAMAKALGAGVTLALSVEPEGGSPTGLPTGPVIAAGKLASL